MSSAAAAASASAPSSDKSCDGIDVAQIVLLELQAPPVPYGAVCGITLAGVPCFSNGDDEHFSGESSIASHHSDLNRRRRRRTTGASSDDSDEASSGSSDGGQAQGKEVGRRVVVGPAVFGHVVDMYHQLGIKWQCVEFARRFLLMRQGVWLRSVPVAETIWNVPHVTNITTGGKVRLARWGNGSRESRPAPGDILIWQRAHDVPFGHVAVVVNVTDSYIQIAEQNEHFLHWQGRNYGRTIPVAFDPTSRSYTIMDEDVVLGWMRADAPVFDFATDDAPDAFRHIVSKGTIKRVAVPQRDTSLAWLDLTNPADFFLKRSLVVGGEIKEGAVAAPSDVPGGYYVLDYNMWGRLRSASLSLHEIAMESTWHVIAHDRSQHLLETHFGIPAALHGLLRQSMEVVPPMLGRFDFGYDGTNIVMLEYNCDSSGALLECMRTQGAWCRHHGVDTVGECTGSFLRAKMVRYFKWLAADPAAEAIRPSHSVIHFMIDNDDEERYTALSAMQCAEECGFKCKLCVKTTDFRFSGDSRCHPQREREGFLDDVTIVDLEGVPVELVWKTWSWDTVLRQYAGQVADAANVAPVAPVDAASTGDEATRAPTPPPPQPSPLLPVQPASSRRPTLSDLLLNAKIHVLEPLWKAVTGSKALLPIMYGLYPSHPNMVRAAFTADREMVSQPYLSKPVNGRAGQNITMYDAAEAPASNATTPELQHAAAAAADENGVPTAAVVDHRANKEESTGRFYDSLLVYQRRCFLRPFDETNYPIFCGWMVGEGFGGVVVREDTSKITKLNSVCVPCRVVRK